MCNFEVFCIWQHSFRFTKIILEKITGDTAGVRTKLVNVFAIDAGMV